MSGSMTYWNAAEAVRDELKDISVDGENMFGNLEADDDPGQLAEALADIEKRLTKLAAKISLNVPALRKVGKALDDVPGVK